MTARQDWLRAILEADGIADYREVPRHVHRVDWAGRVMSIVSMALVGFVIVSAAVAIARSRPQITAEQDALRSRVIAEQARTSTAERAYARAQSDLAATQAAVRPDLTGALAKALDVQAMASAFRAVRGPGVVLELEDSLRPTYAGTTNLGRVIDRDVQHAVNGLWEAGAEAVSVNGIRLTSRTSIRNAGSAILVDYKPISAPLRIAAIGNGARLLAAFRATTEWQELLQLRDRYRIRWSASVQRTIRIPAGSSALPTVAIPGGSAS